MARKKSDAPGLFDGNGLVPSQTPPISEGSTVAEGAAVEAEKKPGEDAPTKKKVALSRFVENPDNPQTVTDEAFERLIGKLRRVPAGLMAQRIAYVTDHSAGEFVVLSGNKRLRALKAIYGADGHVPAEWFKDITKMTEDERREFLVNANINEGEWDVEKLLEQYDRDELGVLMDGGDLKELLADIEQGAAAGEVASQATDESRAFEEKFVPKKTTDDCYTPENIFAAVLEWAAARYGFDPSKIVRPFYPGGNYQTASYPAGYTVVDNPPFSIFSEIVKFYCEKNIPFFLFGPALTLSSTSSAAYPVTYVVVCSQVRYDNGAIVSTSFVTNLDPETVIDVCPDLRDKLKAINDFNRKGDVEDHKKHDYPIEVVSCALLNKLSMHKTPFRVKRSDAVFIRQLDEQVATKDAIFGGGFILSERAAAERAAAERAERFTWKLSDREREIQKGLGK